MWVICSSTELDFYHEYSIYFNHPIWSLLFKCQSSCFRSGRCGRLLCVVTNTGALSYLHYLLTLTETLAVGNCSTSGIKKLSERLGDLLEITWSSCRAEIWTQVQVWSLRLSLCSAGPSVIMSPLLAPLHLFCWMSACWVTLPVSGEHISSPLACSSELLVIHSVVKENFIIHWVNVVEMDILGRFSRFSELRGDQRRRWWWWRWWRRSCVCLIKLSEWFFCMLEIQKAVFKSILFVSRHKSLTLHGTGSDSFC